MSKQKPPSAMVTRAGPFGVGRHRSRGEVGAYRGNGRVAPMLVVSREGESEDAAALLHRAHRGRMRPCGACVCGIELVVCWFGVHRSTASSSCGNSSRRMRTRTPVVDLYARCGRLDCKVSVLDEMAQRSLVSWNSLVACGDDEEEPTRPERPTGTY